MADYPRSKFSHLCQWLIDSGGDYKTCLGFSEEGRMYTFIEFRPAPNWTGRNVSVPNYSPDYEVDQAFVIWVRRRLGAIKDAAE